MKIEAWKFPHGQDAGKLLVAIWLFVSPWMLNYSDVRVPVWNGNAVGFVVAAFSLGAMLKFTTWEEWVNIGAALWLIASPLVLHYTSLLGDSVTLPAAANHVAVGIFIIVLSGWELTLSEEARDSRKA